MPTTSYLRQPKLFTQVRGQTYVQLGTRVDKYDLGSSAFARHYSRNQADIMFRLVSCETVRNMKSAISFFSFPLGTEMFHFPRFPPHDLCIRSWVTRLHRVGLPHSGILGSQVACHLPEAYRRLRRPSSAPSCQAIHRMPFRASAIRMRDPARVTSDGPIFKVLRQLHFLYTLIALHV